MWTKTLELVQNWANTLTLRILSMLGISNDVILKVGQALEDRNTVLNEAEAKATHKAKYVRWAVYAVAGLALIIISLKIIPLIKRKK